MLAMVSLMCYHMMIPLLMVIDKHRYQRKRKKLKGEFNKHKRERQRSLAAAGGGTFICPDTRCQGRGPRTGRPHERGVWCTVTPSEGWGL